MYLPSPRCLREDRTPGLWGRRCPCRGWSGWLCRTASSSASWCWRWCPGRARHSMYRTWHFWWKLALLLTIGKNVFDWLWNENIVMWSGFNFIHNGIKPREIALLWKISLTIKDQCDKWELSFKCHEQFCSQEIDQSGDRTITWWPKYPVPIQQSGRKKRDIFPEMDPTITAWNE